VLLDVTDVVELKLELVERQPVEARLGVHGECVHLRFHLCQDVRQVLKQGCLAVGFCRRRRRSQQLYPFAVLLPGDEIGFCWAEVEVCVDEGVIGNAPKGVYVGCILPEGIWALFDCLA